MNSAHHRSSRLFAAWRACCCTLLAALTTALLAFLPAFFQSIPSLHSSRATTFLGRNLQWLRHPPPDWPANPGVMARTGTIGYRIETAAIMTTESAWIQSQISIGLPFTLATWTDELPGRRGAMAPPGFIALADDGQSLYLNSGTASQTIIPLVPYFPGLLANLFFFTGCWYATSVLSAHLRTRTRRARGQCTCCRYDLKGLPTCPECGHAGWSATT